MTRGAPGTHANVDAHIRSSVAELAAALAGQFASLPNAGRRAPDLVKTLGIDNPLACRVLRVAHAADPAEAVEFMPTVNQIKRVIELASEHAPASKSAAAREAVARFSALVDEFGGDQRGFESLVSALTPRGVRRVEMAHRRAAFRANAHMWGVSSECVAQMSVLLPSADGKHLDLHGVNGFVNIRVTRPNARVMFAARMRPDNVAPQDLTHKTLGEELKAATLMSEFSTVHDAALREVQYAGFRGTRVDFKGVRPADAETIFIHRVMPKVVAIDSDEWARSNSMVSWPCELLHKDMVLPAGFSAPATLKQTAFARREDPKGVFELDAEDEVPLLESPEAILDQASLPETADVPRFAEILDWVMRRHGCGPLRVDVYRGRIEFPMMHSMVSLQVRHLPRKV